MNASREFSTAAVMLHGLVGDHIGLSATDLKALDLLQRMGPQTAGEIATHTGLATASVTSLIDRLERKGFVRRAGDPADRRRVVVTLTRKVEQAVAPLFRGLNRRMLDLSKRYSDAQIATIETFLTGGAREMRAEAAKAARRG
jgi:DNA-binding MarR family transcriptional regulator